MQSNLPFLFLKKKLFCMFICFIQIVGFIILASFSGSFCDSLIKDSDLYPEDKGPFMAKCMTAILTFTIAGAVFHLTAMIAINFEKLYITAVVTLIEVVAIIGAILEAIMIHNIFWISFGVSLFLLAMLALHLFDLVIIQNKLKSDYSTPTADYPEENQ